MSAAPVQPAERYCEHCGAHLVRKTLRSGRAEMTADWLARKFCDVSCARRAAASRRQQRPAGATKRKPTSTGQADAEVVAFPFDPRTFSRVYQAALARGVDLLELNDATWEP